VVQCGTVWYSVVQCCSVVVWCSVVQCRSVLQCLAVSCSVLPCSERTRCYDCQHGNLSHATHINEAGAYECVSCNALQCVAVCCSVFQYGINEACAYEWVSSHT